MILFLYNLFALVLVCLYFLTQNQATLYFGYDGAYMKQLFNFHFEWSPPTTELVFNPLQGMANFTFPLDPWLSPACLTSYVFFGSDPDSVTIYTITSLEFFASMWLLARSLGATPGVKIAASWIATVSIMPFVAPHLFNTFSFYTYSVLGPWWIEHMAVINLALSLILIASTKTSRLALSSIVGAGVAILYSVVAFPFPSMLALPLLFLFVVNVDWTLGRSSWPRNFIWAMLILVLFLAVPMIFIASLTLQTVPSFFSDELIYGRPTWMFISILFHGPIGIGWMSSVIFVTGLSGALLALRHNDRRFATTARFYAMYSSGLLLLGFVFTFVFATYRGPSMLYFEFYIYPFMFVYTCWLAKWLVDELRSRSGLVQKAFAYGALHHRAARLLIPVCVAAALLAINRPAAIAGQLPWPPRSTSITEVLKREIGLTPGSLWRGSVATFNGAVPEGTTWESSSSYDLKLWRTIGNDHRAVGLWWLGIPTLFAYNQFMSPDYYYLMTRFLAEPADRQVRSVIVLTKPDLRFLRLFGVRFVISDTPLSERPGLNLRESLVWGDKPSGNQYLYEVELPNLGNFSSTVPLLAATAADALATMRGAGFDPKRQVVVQDELPAITSEAVESSLYWERDGLRIKAKSAGRALLVLPVQYSRCLTITQESTDPAEFEPRLFRADIGLTGVLFSTDLNAKIRLRFGPFDNVFCRAKDFLQFRRMWNLH